MNPAFCGRITTFLESFGSKFATIFQHCANVLRVAHLPCRTAAWRARAGSATDQLGARVQLA